MRASAIRAVAWDIDGTLIDSEPLHQAALFDVSARYGAAIVPHDPRFFGRSLDDVWLILREAYPPSLTRARWLQAMREAYLAGTPHLLAFPDVLDTMRRLHGAGIAQCCVSNSVRAVVDANVAALGILDLLAFTISRDDVAIGKPDPEPYAEACRRLRLPPAEVLAVEDSPPGIASAREAGCPVLRYGVDFDRHTAVADRVFGGGLNEVPE